MEYDEIRVFVVDEAGNEVERHGWVQYSREVEVGQEIRLKLKGPVGPERRFRVVGVRPGKETAGSSRCSSSSNAWGGSIEDSPESIDQYLAWAIEK